MSLADILLKAFTGQKITAKQEREAAAALDEIARQFLTGGPPPAVIDASDERGAMYRFRYQGFRVARPGEWHLCGMPPKLRAELPRGVHRCHIYGHPTPVLYATARPGTRQKAPPPPARPSRASEIHRALESLGIHQASRAVWPPPASEIRATFLSLSKQLHPDKNPGDAAAERRYKEITAAYTLLKGEGIA